MRLSFLNGGYLGLGIVIGVFCVLACYRYSLQIGWRSRFDILQFRYWLAMNGALLWEGWNEGGV